MLILSFISNGLEFCSLNQTSIYENSELKFFKNIKVLGDQNNRTKYILGKNV